MPYFPNSTNLPNNPLLNVFFVRRSLTKLLVTQGVVRALILASKFRAQPWVSMCWVSSLAPLCHFWEDVFVVANVCICVLSVLHGVVSSCQVQDPTLILLVAEALCFKVAWHS